MNQQLARSTTIISCSASIYICLNIELSLMSSKIKDSRNLLVNNIFAVIHTFLSAMVAFYWSDHCSFYRGFMNVTQPERCSVLECKSYILITVNKH